MSATHNTHIYMAGGEHTICTEIYNYGSIRYNFMMYAGLYWEDSHNLNRNVYVRSIMVNDGDSRQAAGLRINFSCNNGKRKMCVCVFVCMCKYNNPLV